MTEQLVKTTSEDGIYTILLARPDKRNAISDRLLAALEAALVATPEGTRAILLAGEGKHFCAGLDLSEHQHRDAFGTMLHSQSWHRIFARIQNGGIPVIAALQGAVIGGGLELATAAHIRVAERSAYYGLPEGQRGIFVGGGGSVRLPRLMGTSRMADMMLTGRVFDADEGQQAGLSNYLVDTGSGLDKGMALAQKICGNAPLSNFSVIQALPRIAELAPSEGLFVESLVAAIAQGDPAAKERIRAFLEGRAAKVAKQ